MVEAIVNSLNRFFESNNVFLDLYRISDNKINKILIKYNNKFYLIDRRCPHFGLPLISSHFFDNYITCRWHGCRFSFIPDSAAPKEKIIKSVIIDKEDTSWIENELQN